MGPPNIGQPAPLPISQLFFQPRQKAIRAQKKIFQQVKFSQKKKRAWAPLRFQLRPSQFLALAPLPKIMNPPFPQPIIQPAQSRAHDPCQSKKKKRSSWQSKTKWRKQKPKEKKKKKKKERKVRGESCETEIEIEIEIDSTETHLDQIQRPVLVSP